MVWTVCKPQSGRWQGRKLCCQAGFEFFDHTTHPAQIGVLRPTAYWEAMQDVYRQCYAVLPVGGHLVLVVKGMIRQGRYVDTPTRTAALLEEVGFVVQHWHHAMLTAREAQLTFDGREERQRHLSFFRRVHAWRDARVLIDHEVVLCAGKSRASLSSARARTCLRSSCPLLLSHDLSWRRAISILTGRALVVGHPLEPLPRATLRAGTQRGMVHRHQVRCWSRRVIRGHG